MRPDPSLIGWYYKRPDGERTGPLTSEEVSRLLVRGQLRPSDMLVEIAERVTAAGPEVHYSYLDAATAANGGRTVPHRSAHSPDA